NHSRPLPLQGHGCLRVIVRRRQLACSRRGLDSSAVTIGGLAMLRKSRLGLLLLFIVAIPFLLLSTGSSRADDRDDQDRDKANGPVKLLKTIPVPVSPLNSTAGAMYSFDISFVDQATGGYFLADRSNRAVDVVNANTGTFVRQIFPNNGHGPFAGFTACVGVPGAGPNDCAG